MVILGLSGGGGGGKRKSDKNFGTLDVYVCLLGVVLVTCDRVGCLIPRVYCHRSQEL